MGLAPGGACVVRTRAAGCRGRSTARGRVGRSGEYTDAVVKRRDTRTFNHPIVGEITLNSDTLTYDAERDQQLIVYTHELGSLSEESLHILASWAAQRSGVAQRVQFA